MHNIRNHNNMWIKDDFLEPTLELFTNYISTACIFCLQRGNCRSIASMPPGQCLSALEIGCPFQDENALVPLPFQKRSIQAWEGIISVNKIKINSDKTMGLQQLLIV